MLLPRLFTFGISVFILVVPKECDFKCKCYYSPIDEANIFNCSNINLTHLPDTALNGTNWLIVSGNNLNQMIEVKKYMNEIVHLDVSNNDVTDISGDVLTNVLKKARYLNIAKNSLKQLPEEIAKATNDTELWIGNNPYDCNCGMMWMKDWLLGAPKVMDKKNVKCATGKMKGKNMKLQLHSGLIIGISLLNHFSLRIQPHTYIV